MNRLLFGAALLGALACSNAVPGNQGNYCTPPWGIGPSGTGGACGLAELCVPAAYATCVGNDCCHPFCQGPGGCSPGVACVTISPDVITDGGAPGCECTDAGPCVCADAGTPCFRSSCLGVCGE